VYLIESAVFDTCIILTVKTVIARRDATVPLKERLQYSVYMYIVSFLFLHIFVLIFALKYCTYVYIECYNFTAVIGK